MKKIIILLLAYIFTSNTQAADSDGTGGAPGNHSDTQDNNLVCIYVKADSDGTGGKPDQDEETEKFQLMEVCFEFEK
ncbi:hypothetical protein [Marinicella sp. W31]|uniref:hypothetical protein n=1 Tax=Marinicella sp. W31 TaxID=3023713 RepID=UPI0037573FA7